MSQELIALNQYCTKLAEIYNLTLNVLMCLEGCKFDEAIELQKKTNELLEEASSLAHEIYSKKMMLDENSNALLNRSSSLHYKIELLTQRCLLVIDDHRERLLNKLRQIQIVKTIDKSQQAEPIRHLTRI